MGGLRASTFILSSSVCYVENGAQTPPPSSPPPAHTLDPGDRPWTLQDQRTHNCNSGRKTAQRQPETPESHSLGPCWVSKHSWATRNVCISPWLQPCQGWRSGWQRKAGTRFARSRASPDASSALGPGTLPSPLCALLPGEDCPALSADAYTASLWKRGVFPHGFHWQRRVQREAFLFFFFFSPTRYLFQSQSCRHAGWRAQFRACPVRPSPLGQGRGHCGGEPPFRA